MGNYDYVDSPEAGYVGIGDITQFTGGGAATCAVTGTGDMYCAGNHGNGRTGAGLYSYEPSPARVGGSGGS